MGVNYKYRKPNLEQYRSIWLTKESHKILRKQKTEQKLSMAQILENILIEKYGVDKNELQEVS